MSITKALHSLGIGLALGAALLAGACANPFDQAPRQGGSAEAPAVSRAAGGSAPFNYGEALQKAIFFYDENRCGAVGAPGNRVTWRGDCHLGDGSDRSLDLSGGWHDAGDHIKFNLPMSYAAGTLLWGLYENADAFKAAGQYQALLTNVKWATDYLVKTHVAPNEIIYQVSNKAYDHNWWGSAEVFDPSKPRPSYKLDSAKPGSAVAGDMAATFALGYLVFKESDPAYAATLLSHAKDTYAFANATRSDAGYTAADGMYNSWSGFWDELLWAATWLHIATGQANYLADAESFVPRLNRQGQSSDIEYQWGHCWDDKHYGALLLLARLTGKPEYRGFIEQHLDWWAAGAKGKTPAGLSWMSEWGSLRYASTAAFLAQVYARATGDATRKARYQSFAETQVDYILGANPQGFSYMIGFGGKYPLHPHHRTAHGSWSDQQLVPNYHRHTLVGALVGGPAAANDGSYTDSINDYQANEVATDYNAGFVGALSFMYAKFGGTAIAGFPQPERPDGPEFFNEAAVNNAGSSYTEIKILTNNRSAWPARYGKSLSYRYYFDISELVAAGYGIADVSVSTNYTEFPVTKRIVPAGGNVYYVEVAFVNDGDVVPRSQSAFAGEVQLRIAGPAGQSVWNPANDFSYQGLGSGSSAVALTEYIPLYSQGTLVFGKQPGPVEPDTTPPAAPRGLAASALGAVSASLDWDDNAESDLAAYLVIVARSADLSLQASESRVTRSQTSLSGLQPDTLYYAGIKAVDKSGNTSPLSAVVSFRTQAPDLEAPAAPRGLAASDVTSSACRLSWTANTEADLAGYEVWQGPSPGFTKATGRRLASASQAGITLGSLAADMSYHFKLSAKDVQGNESELSEALSLRTLPASALSLGLSFVPANSASSTNTLGGRLVIRNNGSGPAALGDLAIGYYLSNESGKNLNVWIDHAGGLVGGAYVAFSAKVLASSSALVSARADTRLRFAFAADAPILAPGDAVEVQFRASPSDWSKLNPTNDWSYADNSHLTVHQGATLIGGTAP